MSRTTQIVGLGLIVLLGLLVAGYARADSGREPGDPRLRGTVGSWTGNPYGLRGQVNTIPGNTGIVIIHPEEDAGVIEGFMDWNALRLDRIGKSTREQIETIHFSFDQDVLEEEYDGNLDQAAALLMANPEVSLKLSGHTDLVGPDDYNDMLAFKRALAVRSALIERGVPAKQLTAVGYGEHNPLDLVATALRLNRRVEVEIHIEIPPPL